MSDFFAGSVWGRSHMGHESTTADTKADSARRSVDGLERKLDRALLAVEALWTLLRDRVGVTEEELADRIVELDLTDGVLDGKVRRPALECRSCRRKIPRRFVRCMYCGVEVPRDPFA